MRTEPPLTATAGRRAGGALRGATYDRPVSVTPIRLYGDPVLRTPAAPVVDFDKELRGLVADLTDTMLAAGGAGLAAPQIGVGLRVFTWLVDGELGHLVNPVVSPVGEETQEGPEGCLSIPGFAYDCRRHLYVAATGFDLHGEPVRVEGSHLLARAVQHEVDHLDGVLFVDRLEDAARAAALAEIAAAEWSGVSAWVPRVEVSPH
jgi:peptide deformylase